MWVGEEWLVRRVGEGMGGRGGVGGGILHLLSQAGPRSTVLVFGQWPSRVPRPRSGGQPAKENVNREMGGGVLWPPPTLVRICGA